MSHDKTDDRDRSDTLDLYNEELARKAVGSLFDDEEDDNIDETEPDGRYVTGFDKPAPERKPRARDSAREAYDRYDDDDYEDDDPETTVYAYRKRERSASTPPPRPAVKVNVASASSRTTRGTHSQNRARPVTSRSEYDDYDDDYEAFRPRDKKRTAEPSARYERPVERTVERSRIERLDRAERSDRAERTERTYNDYDSEPASPVRWVAAALTFVFLIILAFLVYRISVISGELKEARATIAATTANDAEVNELKLDIEDLENQLDEKDAEIALLKSGQTSSQAGDVPQTPVWQTDPTNDNPDTTVDTQPPANNENTLPTVYTVESKDNLSKISTKFYGNANPSNIKKIKDANNLTNDNISIGQKLTIPE